MILQSANQQQKDDFLINIKRNIRFSPLFQKQFPQFSQHLSTSIIHIELPPTTLYAQYINIYIYTVVALKNKPLNSINSTEIAQQTKKQMLRRGELRDKQAMLEAVLHTDFKKSTVLAPIEIKVSRTTFELKEVVRDPQSPDIDNERQIHSLFDQNAQQINCLSRFKSYQMPSQNVGVTGNVMHPKLAICICAYNQDKKMLQQSLKGIYDSLDVFKTRGGITEDEIVVIVIFDGIQNVKTGDYSESMLTFFDEIDYNNGSILREGELSYEEYVLKGKIDSIDWNITSALSIEEINRNKKRRFRIRYEDYMRCKRLMEECEKKDKTIEIENLLPEVRERYIELRESFLKRKTEDQVREWARQIKNEQNRVVSEVEFAQKKDALYEENILKFDSEYKTRKLFVQKAYQKVHELCKKYFASREDTSLIYPLQFQPDAIKAHSVNNPEGTGTDEGRHYLNVLMCVKHRNAGKLSSHALFFLGFCQFMKPDICLLLDVGLKPLDDSIYKMYEYMDLHPKTGGTCGYMGLRMQRNGDEFGVSTDMDHLDPMSYYAHENVFSIQRAQMFQYHLGHLIDKPFEAWFNFIHVLPGAFSCYRFECLDPQSLRTYLKTVLFPDDSRTLQEENRFLAEDRTLSLILKDRQFDFAYIPTAKAVVDPAANLVAMMGQRRRWINGSWFAFFDVYQQRAKIKDCITLIQFYYYYFIHGLVYISMAIFFVSMNMMIKSTMQLILDSIISSGTSMPTDTYYTVRDIVTHVICFFYIFILGGVVFLSLQVKNTDKKFQRVYFFASTFLGCYGVMVLALTAYNLFVTFRDGIDAPVFGAGTNLVPPIYSRVLMTATVGIYALHVIFAFSPRIWFEVALSTPSAIFYSPTYLHLLMIYAFCKIDDFSWGTKGLDKQSVLQKQKQQANKIRKYKHVYKYIGLNVVVGLAGSILISYDEPKQIFIAALAGLLFFITFFKFFFSTLYLMKYFCTNVRMGYSEKDIADNKKRGERIKVKLNSRIDAVKDRAQQRTRQMIMEKLNVAGQAPSYIFRELRQNNSEFRAFQRVLNQTNGRRG